jgi:hypothetical protein
MSPDELLAHCTPHALVTPFVRRYGQFFKPSFLPTRFRRGRFAACFASAYRMAVRHKVTYVEGYAISHKQHAHLHAWCVDDCDNVLDRTWADGRAYFGIPFKTAFLRNVIASRRRAGDVYFGLLDDWEAGWPLIQNLADSPEIWMAVERAITSGRRCGAVGSRR